MQIFVSRRMLGLLVLLALSLTGKTGWAATLDFGSGWNLASSRVLITVADTFSNPDSFISVWKWQGGKWAVYLPDEATPGSYATSKGFVPLTAIDPGEGFWVNAKVASSLTLTGTESMALTLPLAIGWNLKGLLTPDPVTASSVFDTSVPVFSVWKWQTGKWAVLLPCEAQAGAYATSKGFIPLTTIEPGAGFWVNASAAVEIPLATLSVANKAQALGPLAGAKMEVYALNNLASPIATAIADEQGLFPAVVSGGPLDRFLLLRVSGGKDLDTNADGMVDDIIEVNAGSFYALLTAKELLAGGFKVSLLTDLAWRYTKNMVADFSPEAIALRLDDVAKVLIVADLDGDGAISRKDLLAFNPQVSAHKAKLNFDFQMLLTKDENGDSLISAHHANQEETILALLEQKFGAKFTLYPVADSRTETVKVEVTALGKGSIKSAQGAIDFDSDPAVGKQVSSDFYGQDAATTLTITATPKADTKLLGWSGCDTVSDDLAQCLIALGQSRHPVVTFAYTEVQVAPSLVDLSNASVTVGPDTLEVSVVVGDSALLAKLAALDSTSYVVGSTGGGFLRKVASVQKVDAYHYTLATTEAALDEVVKQGTGSLNMQMTNEDLAVAPATPLAKMTPGSSLNASGAFIPAVPGVDLLAPVDPKSRKFKLRIGQPGGGAAGLAKEGLSASASVTLHTADNGATLKATGEVDLGVGFDVGASYGWSGLEYLKFIPEISATELLTLTGSGVLSGGGEAKLGTLNFKPIVFTIGVVPVWITPQVDIYLGAKATLSATVTTSMTLKQEFRAGFTYDKASSPAWSVIHEFTPSWDLSPPQLSAAASLTGYLKPEISMLVYGATGPSIPVRGGLSVLATPSTGWQTGCNAGVDAALKASLHGDFAWDLWSTNSKFGKFIDLDSTVNLSFALFDKEWLVKEWQVGGECGQSATPPHLEVKGLGIAQVVAYQAGDEVSASFEVTNSGDEPLTWAIGYQSGPAIQVSPAGGVLNSGQIATVTVSVATAKLGLGVYANTVKFVNSSLAGQKLPDTSTGNTSRPISINVTTATLAAPVLSVPSQYNPTALQLSWSYGGALPKQVKGYRVYWSVNGGDWALLATITNPQVGSTVLGNLQPGATHSFQVTAYGDAVQSAASNVVSFAIPAVINPPSAATCPLNDTGITWYGSLSENFLTSAPVGFAGQDADYGRDHLAAVGALAKVGGGSGGFDFTKLDENGQAMPASATSWSCVRDNHTGLVWEEKTADGGLRDQGWGYSWYNSNPATNGGVKGSLDPFWGKSCGETLSHCNTEAYTAAVNQAGLCGASDWRLPWVQELQSIVDYGRSNPSIDTEYFPHTPLANGFWSSSPYAFNPDSLWYVNFENSRFNVDSRNVGNSVRLVRGGQ